MPDVPFSLFADDHLRVAFASLGLGSHRPFAMVRRCAAAVLVTWVPMAILAWRQGLVDLAVTPTNFFADFAAYAIFLVGLPLFLVSEKIIDGSTREAADDFFRCGVIAPDEAQRVGQLHATLKRWRESWRPEIVCVALAFILSLVILVPQFGPNPLPTWHVEGEIGARRMTAAGCWAFFIAIPFINYIWLRLIFKILMWIYYLYHVSRTRLDLHPTNPDLTGGLGFISETQGRFAVFILAYGISNVAAPVGYQIAVQNYDLSIMPVWGPIVGFIIGAPLLFTLPLFMFTKQLYRTKKRALATIREAVAQNSRQVEARWLSGVNPPPAADDARQLADQATLGAMFARIEHMRVVPFDLRSFSQLIGSTLGSMATLLPLLHSKGEISEIVEAVSKMFQHFASH